MLDSTLSIKKQTNKEKIIKNGYLSDTGNERSHFGLGANVLLTV